MAEDSMTGTHPQMEYSGNVTFDRYHTIDVAFNVGDFQDLIHWSQLTDEARKGLETANFGQDIQVPFNDANFETDLEYGWFKPPSDL
ncbi:hypothetical protein ON010_g19119 [Phytophthora cinnamomi]|nr:hypothetical protein ON010_g19119 [Phytophthora cinnamomi]